MFKEIFGKFKFDSSKVYISDEVNVFTESKREKWVTELK